MCSHTRKHRRDPLALRNKCKGEQGKELAGEESNKTQIHTANKCESFYFYSVIYMPGLLPISSIFNLQQISLNCAETINLGPFEGLGQQCNNNTLYKLNILEIHFPFDLQW